MPLPNYSGQFVTASEFSRSVAGDEPFSYSIHVIDAGGGQLVGQTVVLADPQRMHAEQSDLLVGANIPGQEQRITGAAGVG